MSMNTLTRQQKIHLLDDLIAAHDAVTFGPVWVVSILLIYNEARMSAKI